MISYNEYRRAQLPAGWAEAIDSYNLKSKVKNAKYTKSIRGVNPLPSASKKQHDYWLYVLHDPNSTEEQKKVAQEYLDADKALDNYQNPTNKGVVGIIKKDKKYLVLYHNKFKKITFPMGKVDEDDVDEESALKREMKEELGIDVVDCKLILTKTVTYKKSIETIYIFSITKYNGEVVNNEPTKHKNLKWITGIELIHLNELNELTIPSKIIIEENILK